MGNKWEVHKWAPDRATGVGYQYYLEYSGNSLFAAVMTLLKLKRKGISCIKIEFRPA